MILPLNASLPPYTSFLRNVTRGGLELAVLVDEVNANASMPTVASHRAHNVRTQK